MENNQMTIHDILRFPRRVSEVLDDLHAAAKFVEGASLNYSVVGDAVASRAVADSALYRAKKEIDALRARVNELESSEQLCANALHANSKSHLEEVGRLTFSRDQARERIVDLESQLLTARDSLDCANNEITDRKIRIDKLEGKVAQLKRNNTEIDATRCGWILKCNELESQLKDRDSQPLPWRPITEDMVSHSGRVLFLRRTGAVVQQFADEDIVPGDATHFIYLDGPMPAKPEPEVVAWAVVDRNSALCQSFGRNLVFDAADTQAEERAITAASSDRGNMDCWRAARLAIVED
jgi:hypothetical protein